MDLVFLLEQSAALSPSISRDLDWVRAQRAAGRSLGVLSQDAAAALISLPVQLLFKIVFTTIRLVRRAKQALGMTPPKMPPLTTA